MEQNNKFSFLFKFSLLFALLNGTLFAEANYQVNKIVNLPDTIWGMDFIDNQTIIASLKSGKFVLVDLPSKTIEFLSGNPKVFDDGQGGLMDVKKPTRKNLEKWFYATYSKDTVSGATTTLARFRLSNKEIIDWQDILISKSQTDTTRHFGSRIAFSNEHIFVSIGDRGLRENAQDLTNHAGKILRLNFDGSIPFDNPFVGNPKALPEIWSYGHRNPQGLYWDSETGNLWSIEHGPRGGDEINLIQKGKNYGWPVISYGKEYWGPIAVGEGTHKEGMEQPVKYYVPSIAPSSIILYRGNIYPELNEKLISGALKLQHLNIIALDNNLSNPKENRILKNLYERIRSLAVDNEGFIYFGTDQGNLYYLTH